MRKAFTIAHGFLLILLVGLVPATARAELRLNEFLAGPARDWDGSGGLSTRDDEWVEVWNDGAALLELSGYFITDGDTLPRFGFSGTLGPQGRVLVFGSQAVDWERANGFPVFGLSLGNTGDRVMLWHAAAGDTTLVDQYVYLAHEAAADRAVGRGTDGGAWTLFDALNPYAGSVPPLGSGCAPSPGAPNQCGPTPALRTSWGSLKALYR
ncbi:MAG TPA: lamin tail domain-containing protein [Candidatus Eisenbacteria bacterium]|nr:lamin tail domain-containing protein [Candidatus Eisenbacteria bacterium]